LCSSIRK
jgi:hypothetical protein